MPVSKLSFINEDTRLYIVESNYVAKERRLLNRSKLSPKKKTRNGDGLKSKEIKTESLQQLRRWIT